ADVVGGAALGATLLGRAPRLGTLGLEALLLLACARPVVADREREQRCRELEGGRAGRDLLVEQPGVELEAPDLGACGDLREERACLVRRDVGGGGDLDLLERGADRALDTAQPAAFGRRHEGDRLARAPGPTRASDA